MHQYMSTLIRDSDFPQAKDVRHAKFEAFVVTEDLALVVGSGTTGG